jgi:hypothetical protein
MHALFLRAYLESVFPCEVRLISHIKQPRPNSTLRLGCGRMRSGLDATARRSFGKLALEKVARAVSAFGRAPLNAHVGRVVGRRVVAIFLSGAIKKLPIARKNSGWTGIFGLRDGSIRKKAIGLTLLQKQTREGCVGVVVHP